MKLEALCKSLPATSTWPTQVGWRPTIAIRAVTLPVRCLEDDSLCGCNCCERPSPRLPFKLHADECPRRRAHLKKRGILSRIARRGIESNVKSGKHRWVVEQTHGWFAGFEKLRIRFEKRLDIHLVVLKWLQQSSAHASFIGGVSDSYHLTSEALHSRIESPTKILRAYLSNFGQSCPVKSFRSLEDKPLYILQIFTFQT